MKRKYEPNNSAVSTVEPLDKKQKTEQISLEESLEELNYTIFKKYCDIYQNPPSLQNNPTEFWRQFVDANQQIAGALQFRCYHEFSKTFKNIYHLNRTELEKTPAYKKFIHPHMKMDETLLDSYYTLKLGGWPSFIERESGYLEALVKAKIHIEQFKDKDFKITLEFIKDVQKWCMSDVKDTLCTKNNVGTFRKEKSLFNIVNSRYTKHGIKDYFDAIHSGLYPFEIVRHDNSEYKYSIRYDASVGGVVLMSLKENLIETNYDKVWTFLSNEIVTVVQNNESDDLLCLRMSAFGDYENFLDNYIKNEINTYYKTLEFLDLRYTEEQDISLLKFSKLAETVGLIQKLCRLHPFLDGNTRTFVMLLLPFLLHKIELGNVCVFDDPNRFWLLTKQQCIKEVLRALIYAQKITLKIPCDLLEFSNTERILSNLSPEQQEHFETIKNFYIQSFNVSQAAPDKLVKAMASSELSTSGISLADNLVTFFGSGAQVTENNSHDKCDTPHL